MIKTLRVLLIMLVLIHPVYAQQEVFNRFVELDPEIEVLDYEFTCVTGNVKFGVELDDFYHSYDEYYFEITIGNENKDIIQIFLSQQTSIEERIADETSEVFYLISSKCVINIQGMSFLESGDGIIPGIIRTNLRISMEVVTTLQNTAYLILLLIPIFILEYLIRQKRKP